MDKRRRDRVKRHAREELRIWVLAVAGVALFLWLTGGWH